MKKQKIIIFFLCIIISVSVMAQFDTYIWQTPKTTNLSPSADTYIQILRQEVDMILSKGHLTPMRQYFADGGDGIGENYYMYQEPGRIILTLAKAYPYLTTNQQQSVINYVRAELSNANYTVWASNNVLPPAEGSRREFFNLSKPWVWDWWVNWTGNARPRVFTLYGLWLYAYNSNDWSVVTNNWTAIKNFYNSIYTQGNIYGTMCAHIAMARMAHHEGDTAMQNTAVNNAVSNFQAGLNFTNIDNNAKNYYTFNYPWSNSYNRVSSWLFLNLSPEVGRYLKEYNSSLKTAVIERNNLTKSRYPFWYVYRPLTGGWTGSEGIGVPTEIVGMVFPIERWVVGASTETLLSYKIHRALYGIGDSYTLEALCDMISALGNEIWVDVRNTSVPSKILISAQPSSLYADGISSSTVTATICDANGLPVTGSTVTVRFTLTGTAGGSLVGTNPVQAVNGIATITYRAGTSAGTATITATSQGLTDGSVDITLNLPGQATITVIAPNGGQTWTAGTVQTVTWTWTQTVNNVNIDLSTNSGTSWVNLVSNTNNDGSETITVPDTPSTFCRIRVQETDGTPSDMSDGNFSIVSVVPAQPVLSVDKTLLEFGDIPFGKTKTLDFNISNAGEGTLTGNISCPDNWVNIVPENFTAPVTINVTVDNEILGMKEGIFTSTITINSNGGTAEISIMLTATCVLVRPNPYNPQKGPLVFFGSGIVPGNTEIKIWTLAGEKVIALKSDEKNEIIWDGKDEIGNNVMPGIYIYTYKSPVEKGIGKFVIK